MNGTWVYGHMDERKCGRIDKSATQVQQTSLRHIFNSRVTQGGGGCAEKKLPEAVTMCGGENRRPNRAVDWHHKPANGSTATGIQDDLSKSQLLQFSSFCMLFSIKIMTAIFFLHSMSTCNVKGPPRA